MGIKGFIRPIIAAAMGSVLTIGILQGGMVLRAGVEGEIHACVKAPNGQARIVRSESDCLASESHAVWSITGPEGTPGQDGAQGEPGPRGETGLQGPAGAPGASPTGYCTDAYLVGFATDGSLICADEDSPLRYRDGDGDGSGLSSDAVRSNRALAGFSNTSGDCNDANAAIKPGAPEVVDGVDNNCNGQVDEAVRRWFRDLDADGFGDPNVFVDAATRPSGFVAQSGDCNDTDLRINPAASDPSGDGVDQDCDGNPNG